jgi:hypothetical protein
MDKNNAEASIIIFYFMITSSVLPMTAASTSEESADT